MIGLGLSGLAFATSLCAWVVVGRADDARLADLQTQIAERRAAILNRRDSAAEQAIQALQARKRTAPSAVMTLEALAKTLPDDTHLTELRIEDGKVQIVGLSGDAPALIRLIEQSKRFTRATFLRPYCQSGKRRRDLSHRGSHRAIIRGDGLTLTSTSGNSLPVASKLWRFSPMSAS